MFTLYFVYILGLIKELRYIIFVTKFQWEKCLPFQKLIKHVVKNYLDSEKFEIFIPLKPKNKNKNVLELLLYISETIF